MIFIFFFLNTLLLHFPPHAFPPSTYSSISSHYSNLEAKKKKMKTLISRKKLPFSKVFKAPFKSLKFSPSLFSLYSTSRKFYKSFVFDFFSFTNKTKMKKRRSTRISFQPRRRDMQSFNSTDQRRSTLSTANSFQS